jgi:DNA-binding CsgD family transcriptional regulator
VVGNLIAKGSFMATANPRGLGRREEQIVALLLQGCSNAEIAQHLKMKPRTVKAHFNRLFEHFEIKDGIKRVKLATLLYRRAIATEKVSSTDDAVKLALPIKMINTLPASLGTIAQRQTTGAAISGVDKSSLKSLSVCH